jgi:NitT/TauT family transport system permease protein
MLRVNISKHQETIIRNFFFLFLVAAFVFLSYSLLTRAPEKLFQLISYTAFSVFRIAASYLLSLISAISIGFLMANNKRAERIILPILDILQSVPVVGFFPAAIGIFVALFKGERIGIELASIFLIFTSQAWNMIFGVYESLKVIPKDIKRLVSAYNIRGSAALFKVYLPATIPSLILNSMASWANSWFFLMSSEVFAIGASQFKLPGIGYFIWISSEKGDVEGIVLGLLSIIITVVAMSIFIWEPLTSWSKKYSFQMLPYTEERQENFVLSKIKDIFNILYPARTRYERLVLRESFSSRLSSLHKFIAQRVLTDKTKRHLIVLLKILTTAAIAYAVYIILKFLIGIFSKPLPEEAIDLPAYLGFSFLRLVFAYSISLFLTILFAMIIYFSRPRIAEFIMTAIRVISSIPGTILQPIALAWLLRQGFENPIPFTSIFVLFSTMIWYMIFPVAARVITIPKELKEPVHLFSSSKFFILRKLILPASFPGFVTGSFAAFGAGWNALVVSEFSIFEGKTYSTKGVGFLIDYAAYIKGDTTLLAICLIFLVAVIILLNKLIWQRLYDYAEERFSIDID